MRHRGVLDPMRRCRRRNDSAKPSAGHVREKVGWRLASRWPRNWTLPVPPIAARVRPVAVPCIGNVRWGTELRSPGNRRSRPCQPGVAGALSPARSRPLRRPVRRRTWRSRDRRSPRPTRRRPAGPTVRQRPRTSVPGFDGAAARLRVRPALGCPAAPARLMVSPAGRAVACTGRSRSPWQACCPKPSRNQARMTPHRSQAQRRSGQSAQT